MIVAISEATTVALTTVVVSAVVGPVAVAFASARAKRIEAAIGEPNGHGNLATMMAKLLDGQTGQDMRIARQDREIHELVQRVSRIETTCTAIAEHTDTVT